MSFIHDYNIEIEKCVNPETGEFDEDRFNALTMARDEKIESLICYYKDVIAMAKAIKEEENILTERRKREENKANRLKEFIKYALAGEKFKTAKGSVSYRDTESVEVGENFVEWAQNNDRDDLLSYKKPDASKTAIKAAIESGEKGIPAMIVQNTSVIIK